MKAILMKPFSLMKKRIKKLRVVLLLIDPESRRFEFLGIEFASRNNALVADVLDQIPCAIIEGAVRKQDYTAVCACDGRAQKPAVDLKSFCNGNDVLIPIPSGVSAVECARSGRQILSDTKISSLLSSLGVDAQAVLDQELIFDRKATTVYINEGRDEVEIR